MNHLINLSTLNNRYYIIRHGESQANAEKKIISHPDIGTIKYGLTKKGHKQLEESISVCKTLTHDTIIYCSDFLRTKESAEIIKKILNINEFYFSINLRERFFGNWDQTSDANYTLVWEEDLKNPDHNENGVESVNEVMERVTSLIIQLEKEYIQKTILLVSHGDILQILQSAFKKINPSQHRSLPHLNQAEIRELILTSI